MITQRPVTGSLRSCGIESVLHDVDRRLAGVDAHGDDVEAARHAGQAMPHHIVDCDLRHSALLEPRHGLGREAEGVAVAGLDLDEHDRHAVARDEVQFSPTAAVAAGKNCVPAALELADREIFAHFSEVGALSGHGGGGQQDVDHLRVGVRYVPEMYPTRTPDVPDTYPRRTRHVPAAYPARTRGVPGTYLTPATYPAPN